MLLNLSPYTIHPLLFQQSFSLEGLLLGFLLSFSHFLLEFKFHLHSLFLLHLELRFLPGNLLIVLSDDLSLLFYFFHSRSSILLLEYLS